jgi:hypothetical protein
MMMRISKMATTEPRLPTRESEGERTFVAPEILEDEAKMTLRELPWYAVFRIPIGQLIAIGTILISIAGVYAKVSEHERVIAEVRSASQTKEAASSDAKLILQKLETMDAQRKEDRKDLLDRLDRLEDRLDERPKGRR